MPTAVRASVAIAAIVAAVCVGAQERPTVPQFTTGTEAVLVDVVVRDHSGHAVGGLSADDFVVKEDGKTRPIVWFTSFEGGPAPAVSARGPAARPARAPLTSTVVLVDDGHLTPRQAADVRPALKTLLAKLGDQSGALSMVAPWSKVSVAGALPAAAPDLASAVDRIAGHRFEDYSSFPVFDAEAFAAVGGDARTIGRLTGRFMALNPSLTEQSAAGLVTSRSAEIAHDARTRRARFYAVATLSLDWLAGREGRHSVIVVSGGFAREPSDMTYRELVTRSMRVNAPLHFVDVRGLQGLGLQSMAIAPALSPKVDQGPFGFADAAEGSRSLADDTGGVVVRNTNDLERGLGRVLDAMRTYYIIGYDPPAPGKPGFKRIRVEMKRRGLTVNARRGYFVSR